MQVLFIGDSIIHYNQNKIGSEWLRMLNTNEEESVVNDLIYKKTYNYGDGNIQLVGRAGTVNNKFEFANKLSIIMTGQNTNINTDGNPFYNPSSIQPNELDVEGFNKRVDFGWYFQQVCGDGKYPKYIYMACGVNDIVDLNWDITRISELLPKLEKILLRMKTACDSIAGGESNVKILLFNHQFYPLNNGKSFNDGFRADRQRKIWAKHYENYEKLTEKPTLSGFVRFVDCASSFDVDNGYNTALITKNSRTSKTESYVTEMVHMNENGALLYADALLRDFLYNECS